MKSTVTFKQYFYENMTMGDVTGGSAGGFSPDNITSSDFYASGTTVVPKGGAVYTRGGKIRRSKGKARKTRKNKSKK